MDVRIDDLELIKREDDSSTGLVREIRTVRSINIADKRSIIEFEIPGADGNILQDLGRKPVVIRFTGEIRGENSSTTLEQLRAKFKAGVQLPFSSDLTGLAEVTQVLIEDLRVFELSGPANRYGYDITVREYIEPREEEEETPEDQDEEAEEAVEEETEEAVESVNYVTGKVLDEEGNPRSGVKLTITDEEGNEYEVTTDDEGVYRKDDLPPGKYTVTSKEEGYEDVQREVEVGGSAEGSGEEEAG